MNIQNVNSQNVSYKAVPQRDDGFISKYALTANVGLCDFVIDTFTQHRYNSIKAYERYTKDEISKEELEKELKRRYLARKETGELLTDMAVSVASFNVFKNIAKLGSVTELFKQGFGKKTTTFALLAATATGAVVRPLLGVVDAIGANKEECRKRPTTLNRVLLGALNGVSSPILAASSLWLTVPALLGINTGARYLTGKNDKNLSEYLQVQKDSLLIHGFGTVPELAMFGVKGKGAIKSWEVACKKAKENNELLKAFKNPYKNKADLEELTNMLSDANKAEIGEKLLPIFFNPSENKIIDTNIFIAKWLQTVPDKKIDEIETIKDMPISNALKKVAKNLKGGCPASYTLQEAQGIITRAYGQKYTIVSKEPLGVGTIAETYLAKDNVTGKEVVIKMLKKGISAEKIEADRRQALELLQNSEISKNKQDFTYYQKYINVLFDAWKKETDLSLEKEAAEIIGAQARKFNVVKPIEIKDNVYVMEKAKGVRLNKLDEELKRRNMTLTQDQIRQLLRNYNEVFIEQLISIPRSGQKVVQADPNSSNIFIDLDNLNKPITFLDLGNVLRYDNLTATRNALGHLDYIFGNSQGIAKTNLEGAILPDGLSREEAMERLVKELNTHIFNNKTKVPPPNTINDFCTHIMKEMKIIPNADNTNLIKAEITYFSNIFELRHKIQEGLVREISKNGDFGDKVKTMMNEMKESGDFKSLVRCILTELYTSIKNASFKTQKHAYTELMNRIRYIEENKEQALTTFYGLIA